VRGYFFLISRLHFLDGIISSAKLEGAFAIEHHSFLFFFVVKHQEHFQVTEARNLYRFLKQASLAFAVSHVSLVFIFDFVSLIDFALPHGLHYN
jgi:hypothetical protein